MKVNYCQLSVADENRHHGIALLHGVLKSQLKFAGWGRSIFGDVTFEHALRGALEQPGPLIVNLANPGDENGDFFDFCPEDQRYYKITPHHFWNGTGSDKWLGFANLIDPVINPSRRASPIYLIVWQCHGLAFARTLLQLAGNNIPNDLNIFGSFFPITPQMIQQFNEFDRRTVTTAHFHELEEICRLICNQERQKTIQYLEQMSPFEMLQN